MPVSASTRRFVRERAHGLCEYCHADERWQFVRFTMEHLKPQSAGGGDEPLNLALACRNCNERRGNRLEAFDSETGQKVALFNPRKDAWADHFAWNTDRIRIVAPTPTGRATLDCLDLNDERHGGYALLIRQRDLVDGYHPPAGDPVLPQS